MAAAAAVLALALISHAPAASAFELFGVRLWGEPQEVVAEPVPDPVAYQASLSVDGDRSLEDELSQASILIGDADVPPSGTVGLQTRARNDARRLVAVLYANGYYGGTVAISIAGQPFETIPFDADLSARGPVPVRISVRTGEPFVFGAVDFDPAVEDDFDLAMRPGEVARSGLILQSETRLLNYWRRRGHPLAEIAERSVQADHASRRLDVRLRIAPGPMAPFGSVSVEGADEVDSAFLVRQAAVPVGEPYDPEPLREAEARLRALGVFDSVTVRPGDRLAPDGSIPVTIRVSERKHRTIGVGVTASNTDGLGAEVYWTHRNLLGRAENLRVEAAVGRIGEESDPLEQDYELAVVFFQPGALGALTNLTSRFELEQENPDAFDRQAVSGETYLSRTFSPTLSGRLGLEGEYSHVSDVTGTNDHLLFGIPGEIVYDSRNDPLNPARGLYATGFAEPTHEFVNDTTFLTTRASLAGYLAVDEAARLVLAGRVAAGSILGASVTALPADRRFYAGGGGSIRGYAYQAASPRNAAGTLVGGLSFVESSLELRFAVTDTFGLVPFLDVGGAFSDRLPGSDGDWFAGAGLGLRYLTPVGPLRLDVAVPLKEIAGEPDYGVYVGLGQAF